MSQENLKTFDSVNKRTSLYFLAIPILVLYTLCITGCISNSPGIAGIFMIMVQQNTPDHSAQVRVGYFGLCNAISNSSAPTCISTTGASVDSVSTQLFSQVNSTSISNLVNTAIELQQKILISPLIAAAPIFLIGLFSLLYVKISAKKQKATISSSRSSRKYKLLTLGLLWLSTALSFTATFTNTEVVNALQFATNLSGGNLALSVGMALQVLQWVVFGLSFLFSVGVTMLFEGGDGSGVRGQFGYPSYSNETASKDRYDSNEGLDSDFGGPRDGDRFGDNVGIRIP